MIQSNVNKTALLSGIMIILGIILPYIGIENEFLGRDEAYQALCVMDYSECPLAMFTFYVGNLWMRLFGNEILSLRCLMVACYQISIGISCWYLYIRKRNLLLTATIFLMMNMGFRYVAMTLYGWDAGAYPYMTIFVVSLLVYVDKPSLVRISLVGIASGVMVMSRIPTLSALPFIFFIIIYVWRNDKKNMLLHCIFGLLFFFVSIFVLIMIMMSGDIHRYIMAWSPDNIINGHFDMEFVVWRLKDTSRRVMAAFYPMICCFACACYMVRVQRRYRLNYVLCGMVCSILSFYFLKTYRMYFEFACGIYESLFLILLLFPWLYNMTHREKISIETFPLIVILGCALLAAVGSDGFLERPMTVNTIPLLCIYIYNDDARVLKHFFVFALLSSIAMFVLMVVSDMKNIRMDHSNKMHLSGIKSGISGDKVVERFVEVSPLIESLRNSGSKYAIVGTDRYEFDYVYGDGVKYNLHHFHYFDREEDINEIAKLVGRYEYILMLCALNGSPYTNTEKYLCENGYAMVDEGHWCRLFRLQDALK